MSEDERALYDDIVHRLRMRGWDTMNADAEAADIIERRRARFSASEVN